MPNLAIKKILIAVNASEYCIKAAKVGFALADQLNAEAALLFVVDTTKTMGNIETGITHNDALLILKKEAEETLDQLAAMFDGPNLLKFMPEGHPKEEIYKTAEMWGANLIVITLHSKSGFAHLFSDNTTEYVIHHTAIPILAVPCK